VNRRNMIKLLSLTSIGLGLTSSRKMNLRAFGSPLFGPSIKIFLHGFFFVDVQNSLLVVGAPDHPNHHFLFRSDGDTKLTDIPMSVQDFQGKLTPAGNRPQWPKSILNFPKATVGLDPKAIDTVWSNSLRCLLLLPFPNRITPHRNGGSLSDFTLGGNVGNAIRASCDQNLSLSLSLEYDSSNGLDFQTRHYYAEHCDTPNDDEIADMLLHARNAFGPKFKQQFDLQMTHIPTTGVAINPTPEEQTLGELSGLGNNPCPALADNLKKTRNKMLDGLTPEQRQEFLVRTANCPMFGMT
jgi:hypothetical protein